MRRGIKRRRKDWQQWRGFPSSALRFNTCGAFDDGKSTLIGRLLYDSKSLMDDQIEALERSADLTGSGLFACMFLRKLGS